MKQMPAEFSQSKGLYLPPNVAAEIDAVRKTEKRGFRKIEVDARLGSTALDCLYYHPDVATDDTPIGIAEGLGAPRGVYLEVAEAVAELGRPVILYKPPRVENALSAFQPENIRDPLIFQMKAVHAALKAIHNSERVTELRGGRPVSEVDLAGHSMGNYIAVGAAHHDTVEQPGDVSIRTLTSIAGAGLDWNNGPQQLQRHAKRMWPGIILNEVYKGAPYIIKASSNEVRMDAINHIFRNLPRLLRETVKIVWSPGVHKKARDLIEHGVPYGAILPAEDEFFYHVKVLQRSGDILGDNYDVVPNANHVYPNTHPKEFAPHLIGMTNVLKKQRQEKRAA
jgi:pimeloyl-ACP methyl ester carboxylesterase